MSSKSFATLVVCFLILPCVRAREFMCHTLGCNKSATLLLEYMDLDVDPCNDFYSFTCGKFLENYVLPEKKMRVSAYQFLEDELNNDLKVVLDENAEEDAPTFEKATKTFYKSCINDEAIEEADTRPLLRWLDYFGGWPVMTNSWNESSSDLTSFLVAMRKMGFNELFVLGLSLVESNSTHQLPVIFYPKVTFQLDENQINFLKSYMTQIIQLLTNSSRSDQIDRDIEDMLEFEVNLSKIIHSPEQRRLKRRRLTTVADVAQKFQNSIQFDVYIKAIFEEAGISIQSDQLIELYYSPYIDRLPDLLERTRPRVIINYLLWKFINELIPALPRRFVVLKDEFTGKVCRIAAGVPRWKKCLTISNEVLPGPVGALYSKKHFRSTAKETMLKLIRELKGAFSKMLTDNLWMTEETKIFAQEKANFMTENIGYPDEYLDDNFYDEILAGAELIENSFLDNCIILRKHMSIENLKHLRKQFSNASFIMPVTNINGFYLPHMNLIEFPAGILQYPFFNEEMPMYQNFGGIGYVIGHEITHGFDEIGRLYNKDGNAVNWWKEEDINKFVNLSQCFVDLYNGFVVEGINETVNGRQTLRENIADIGGLKEAFLAYKNWQTKYSADPLMPGFLNYSQEQMFFIHFGMTNCVKSRLEIKQYLIKMDNHSPGKFRVNGAVMNLREFAETFNCPVGAPMNPADKCHIW